MAADLLHVLLRINLAGSAAIVAVLLIRKPVRRLAGARLAYGLWLAVPLIIAAAFIPARQIVVFQPAPVSVAAPAVVEQPASIPPAPAVQIAQPEQVPIAPPPASFHVDPTLALIALWSLGATFGLAFVLWRHLAFLRALGPVRRRPDGLSQATTSQLGPAVLGVFRPRIVLPADFETAFSPAEQAVIIAHEAAHVAGGHVQANAIAVLAQWLNWFNPLAHLAVHLLRIDQELACDEAVVARAPDIRRTYAAAMLKTQFAEAALALGCYWPSRSPHPLRERVALLARPTPGRARRAGGAAVLGVMALTGAATAWAVQPPVVRVEARAPLAPNAIGGSSSAPTQPLPSVTQSAPPNVTPVAGSSSPADALVAAIAAGDIRAALNLGATARDIAEIAAANAPANRPIDPDSAYFSKTPNRGLALNYGCIAPHSCEYTYIIATQNPDGSFGPPPPLPPPSQAMVTAGQMVLAGRSAQDIAAVVIADMADNHTRLDGKPDIFSPALAAALDPSTARLYQTSDGGVGIGISPRGGGGAMTLGIPGAESYARLSSLPTRDEAFPRLAGPSPPPPAPTASAISTPGGARAASNPKAAAIAAAVAGGDVARTIQNGGTAGDVAAALLIKEPPAFVNGGDVRFIPVPATAHFARRPGGLVLVEWTEHDGGVGWVSNPEIRAYVPPGGVDSLPISVDSPLPYPNPSGPFAMTAAGDANYGYTGPPQAPNSIPLAILRSVQSLPGSGVAVHGFGACDPSGARPNPAAIAAALAANDVCKAAILGASAAQILRSVQARGQFPGIDPDSAVIHIGPDGALHDVYVMKPLPSLDGALPPGVAVHAVPDAGGHACFNDCGYTILYPSGPNFVPGDTD